VESQAKRYKMVRDPAVKQVLTLLEPLAHTQRAQVVAVVETYLMRSHEPL